MQVRSIELFNDLLESEMDALAQCPFPRCERLNFSVRQTPGLNVLVNQFDSSKWPLLRALGVNNKCRQADVHLRLGRLRLRTIAVSCMLGSGIIGDMGFDARALQRLSLCSRNSMDLGVLGDLPRLRALDIECPYPRLPDALAVSRLEMLAAPASTLPWFAAALPEGAGKLLVYCGDGACSVDVACMPPADTIIFKCSLLTLSCDTFGSFVDFTAAADVIYAEGMAPYAAPPHYQTPGQLRVFSRADRIIALLAPDSLPMPRVHCLPPAMDTKSFCRKMRAAQYPHVTARFGNHRGLINMWDFHILNRRAG